jgi:hypothetical protein
MKANNIRAISKGTVIAEIAKIDELIIEAARKGETYIQIDSISGGATAYLQDEGFIVDQIYLRDKENNVFFIKW